MRPEVIARWAELHAARTDDEDAYTVASDAWEEAGDPERARLWMLARPSVVRRLRRSSKEDRATIRDAQELVWRALHAASHPRLGPEVLRVILRLALAISHHVPAGRIVGRSRENRLLVTGLGWWAGANSEPMLWYPLITMIEAFVDGRISEERFFDAVRIDLEAHA